MTSRQPTVRALYLSYEKTLVCYDGVQLFTGRGPRKRRYICVAVPHDGAGERFMCTPVSEEKFAEYMYERIDLYALIKSTTNGKHYWIDFGDEGTKGFLLHGLTNPPLPEWLPDRHVFAGCHTENFEFEREEPALQLVACDHDIHIDGRWDAQDLSALPDLFADNYSFLYALKSNEFSRNSRTQRMFKKFPWRGGFSTVGFYQGLYDEVPRAHRLTIQGISYHSPGEITLSAVPTVVNQIQGTAAAFNESRRELQRLYQHLYDGMSSRELLGRSLDEMDPDPLDLEFVERATGELATAMRFTMLSQLCVLVDNNWIAAAKILMSYFRRIKSLADFFDSGKASFS